MSHAAAPVLEAGNHLREALWLHIPPDSVFDYECTRLRKSHSLIVTF